MERWSPEELGILFLRTRERYNLRLQAGREPMALRGQFWAMGGDRGRVQTLAFAATALLMRIRHWERLWFMLEVEQI